MANSHFKRMQTKNGHIHKGGEDRRKTLPTGLTCYFCHPKPTIMKQVLFIIMIASFAACNNSASTAKTFCDTACLKDTIKFSKDDHKLKPYIYISAANCLPDSVIWSYDGLGINRKLGFADFGGAKFSINKNSMSCYFNDTSYVWLLFNNCESGRGYFAKIPFDKKKNIVRKGSAINNFDPKFSVAQGLVVYTDKGNVFVEEMATGKKDMMTFGVQTDMDYDAMHEILDSVNITATRIWVKVLIAKEWKELEKKITLK